jgi:single-strand DNA-binding protein
MSAIECAFFGALARDAERRTSKAGRGYLKFTVRTGDGDDVTWVGVMCFDEKALELADKMAAGARVYVEGKLSLDEWTGQDGSKRHSLSVTSWYTRLSQIGRNRPRRDEHKTGRERAAESAYAPADDNIDF